jgi:hypothetical protein
MLLSDMSAARRNPRIHSADDPSNRETSMSPRTFLMTACLLAAPLLAAPLTAMAFTPESGFYSVPNQPGTGLALEIQDQFAFGAGYVYDTTGRPTFVTVQGAMVKSGDSWVLDSPLYVSSNGQCIGTAANCPYKAATTVTNGTAHIDLPAENILTLTWGAAGNQQNLTMLRFGYGAPNERDSLLGEWDVITDQGQFQNAGKYLFSGDKFLLKSSTAAGGNVVALNGCVPTHEGDTTCSAEKLTLTFTSGGGFGTLYTVAVQDASNVVLRRYRFGSNGLGGNFTQTFKGTMTTCTNTTTDVGACTGADYKMVGYRSGSRQYAQSGSGMD